jgi:hypothetical protein
MESVGLLKPTSKMNGMERGEREREKVGREGRGGRERRGREERRESGKYLQQFSKRGNSRNHT